MNVYVVYKIIATLFYVNLYQYIMYLEMISCIHFSIFSLSLFVALVLDIFLQIFFLYVLLFRQCVMEFDQHPQPTHK